MLLRAASTRMTRVGSMGELKVGPLATEPYSDLMARAEGAIRSAKFRDPDEVTPGIADAVAKATRRVEAIRELSEIISHVGNPIDAAVQCVEALEDLGWADD